MIIAMWHKPHQYQASRYTKINIHKSSQQKLKEKNYIKDDDIV